MIIKKVVLIIEENRSVGTSPTNTPILPNNTNIKAPVDVSDLMQYFTLYYF